MVCEECIQSSNRHERGAKGWLRRLKKTSCNHCGFVALHPCQLDIDHIDGNRDNNDRSNIQTLCANCHRLKTILERNHMDWQADSGSEIQPHPQLRLVE